MVPDCVEWWGREEMNKVKVDGQHPRNFKNILYLITLYTVNKKGKYNYQFCWVQAGSVLLFCVDWCNSTKTAWKDLRGKRLAGP